MKKLLILVPLFFHIQGCNEANATSPPKNIEHEVIHEAQYNEYSDSTSKSAIIIKTQSNYEKELLTRTSETTEIINFKEETIVLIDMGLRNTGGHTINIGSLIDNGEYVRANIVLTSPGNSCATTQANTNPFKLIKLKTTKDILVTEEIAISNC